SDANGYGAISATSRDIGGTLDYANSCSTYYDAGSGMIYFANDSGSWLAPVALGTATTLQNSQCSLDVSRSSASGSGNTLTLNLAITFKSSFSGSKNIFGWAADQGQVVTGWKQVGTWTTNGSTNGPTVVGVSPSSGTGSGQTFSFQYSDANGHGAISATSQDIGVTLDYANSCSTYYDAGSGMIYFANDSGSWLAPVALGTATTPQNSQCSLDVSRSSASGSGNTLTLNLAITFKSSFSGSKNIFGWAADQGQVVTGWKQVGTWTVGSASASAINHVIFMLQENRTFDSYFGMLNPYRVANHWNIGDDGQEYKVDGLDGAKAQISNPMDENTNPNDTTTTFLPFKLATTCTDDMSSAWLESWGDVNRYDFTPTRLLSMNGFVHTAENEAKSNGFGDTRGKRAMGYYDQDFLNYYYFMASNFALSDRWFSPVASKTIPNRIATMSGGTTQGLVYDPSN